jgi:hypothetical protein
LLVVELVGILRAQPHVEGRGLGGQHVLGEVCGRGLIGEQRSELA